MNRFTPLAFLLALAVLPPVAGAQKIPKRPRLAESSDTNDARAYFTWGAQMLHKDPKSSADAFYWATRIDPTMADAWYGRRVALLMSDARFERYMDGNKGTMSQLRGVDSLLLRALSLEPSLFRQFDREMIQAYYRVSITRSMERAGQTPNIAMLDHYIANWLRDSGPYTRGWLAYGSRDFPQALSLYADAMKSAKHKGGIAAERGNIFLLLGRADSALAMMKFALEEMRKRDDKDEVVFYNSKALAEHSLARAHEMRGEIDLAREAYGRALAEDLAYYPAHVALASLALAQKDTAGALSEYEMAVQLRGDEPRVRIIYGFALNANGKLDEAAEQFRKAAEIEPYFAIPHRWLGQIAETKKDTAAAVEHYRRFLTLSSRDHALRGEVSQRLGALVGSTAGGSE